ncbi:MAG: ATP-binding cassette domain-containing protein [Pseudomonadota bacterium]
MSPSPAPVLSIRALGVTLAPDFAVVIDSLDMARGDVVVMDAPSGAGKSTALGLIAGAIAPDDHPDRAHSIAGQTITARTPRHRFFAPHQVGFVLQTSTLVPYLSVGENITLPLDVAGGVVERDWHSHLIGALGIAHLTDRKPAAISVGQRQRAAIARALLGRPALLMLDEPVSALDPANVGQVEHLVQVLAEDAASAVLLASHQAARGAFAQAQRMGFETRREGAKSISAFALARTDRPQALEAAL